MLIAGMLVMGVIQAYLATTYYRDDREQPLQNIVRSITEAASQGLLGLDNDSLRVVSYMADITEAAVFVTGPDGTVLYSVGPGAPQPGVVIPSQVFAGFTLKAGLFYQQGTLGGLFNHNHYSYGASLYGPGKTLLGTLFASSDASGLTAYLSDTLSTFVLSAALVLLISSILALVLANRTIIPIRRMSLAAQRFGEGDYSARVPVEGDDELARLSVTFNEMANSFEATDISRRSFMGNIAHELRTPMTSIKGFIDGMLDGTIPENQRDKYLAIVSDEVGRLSRLVKNMLDVARMEAGEYTLNNTVFDIWGPIASVFIGAEQRLGEKQLAVEGLDGQDDEDLQPVWVTADEDLVHQVLYNLVDNAIKFAQPGGYIAVRVSASRGVATVGVRNSGQGIDADALPHLFDRFYKADKSRGVGARGAGLGLHICKVLVSRMGGRIWAESSQGEWAEFLFTLPHAGARRSRRAVQG